jgi:RNA polymerase sigma factor (sigma-70 family)
MNVKSHLLALCLKHDRKAEYELYRLSYSYLMGICMRYSRDRDSASEALNLGYMKILSSLSTYKPEIPFKAWIRKIMVNTLIDEYRKKKREKETLTYVEEYFDSSDYSEVNDALSRISYSQIMEEVERLPEATKKVFSLFVIDGFSHKEIGDLLGISEGTSKWHLNAARHKLKEYIGQKQTVLTRAHL